MADDVSLAHFVLYFLAKLKNSTLNTIGTMTIKPLADRVLIEPTPAEEVTVAGIIIPDSAKEKPLKGKVLAAGNGTKDEEMVLKEGDEVLYGKYAGTEIELDGNKYLIMRQSDVLAIVNA
jgi:chaperonin GroES